MLKRRILLVNSLIFSLIWFVILAASLIYFYPLFGQSGDDLARQAEAAETDKIPPEITGVKVESLSATSTTISWTTDEDADSLVNYNLKRDYGLVRDSNLTKKHTF